MLGLRQAGPEDVEQVIALRLAFLREMHPDAAASESEIVELTRRYVADKLPTGEFIVWFAEEDGRVVGTGGLVFMHRPPTLKCSSQVHAYILNMYTLPEYRGRGVATALLEHIIQYVKTKTPARRAALHATEMGRGVYERFGFEASTGYMSLRW